MPTVTCPACHSKLNVSFKRLTTFGRCPTCKVRFNPSTGEFDVPPAIELNEPPPVRRSPQETEEAAQQFEPQATQPEAPQPAAWQPYENVFQGSRLALTGWYYPFAHVATYIFVVLTLIAAVILTLRSAGEGIAIVAPDAEPNESIRPTPNKPPTKADWDAARKEAEAARKSAQLAATIIRWFFGMYGCFLAIYGCSLILIFIDIGRTLRTIATK